MNRQAGYGLALIGAALAIVALFVDYANHAGSYWNLDGTMAAVGLGAAIIALVLALAAWTGQSGWDGWLFAIGAFLVGYWGFFPAVTAFGDWDQTRAGLWLAFVGGLLIAIGAAWAISIAGGARSDAGRHHAAGARGRTRDRVDLPRHLPGCQRRHLVLGRVRALARDRHADTRDPRGSGVGGDHYGHCHAWPRRRAHR